MGWLKNFVRNPVGTVLNTAKEVVTDPGKVLNDIGKTIDQSIIKPIENDPLTFIVAAVAYSYGIPGLEFAGAGSAASVGVATTSSRLAQGDEFDQAVKKGVTAAAVTAAVNYGRDYYRQNAGSGAGVQVQDRVAPSSVDASAVAPVDAPAVAPDLATSSPVVSPNLIDVPTTDLANASYVDPTKAANPFAPKQPSTLSLEVAALDPNPAPVSAPATHASNYTSSAVGPNKVYESALNDPSINAVEPPYVPGSGNQAATGTADRFVQDPNYPTVRVKVDGAPGLPEVVDLSRAATPDTGALSFGSVGDTMLAAGDNAWSLAKAYPYTTAGGLYLASKMGGDEPQQDDRPTGTPSEQIGDSRFYMSLPQLRMKRDYQEYAGDYNRYGQETGTHKFFTDPVYEPIDYAAKDGGYVRMEEGGYMGGGGLSPQIGAPMPQPMQQQQMPQMQQAPMPQMPPMQQQQPVGALASLAQKRPTAMPQQPVGALQKVPGQQQNPNYRYFNYGMVPPSVQPNMPQAQMSQKYATGGLTMAMATGGNVSDGRTDDIPALLSPGEYVMDAETVALLGNGNNDAGAKRLDHMREAVRKQKGGALSKGKISPDAQSPLSYLSGRMA
jgi:hypothetical protein